MAASLPRLFTWSNSRQAWQERLGFVAALAGAWLLWHFSEWLSAAWLTGLWAALLLASAALLRRGWLKLFGPVLFYELVRVARRRRYFLLRGVYAVVLACVFLWLYMLWVFRPGVDDQLSPREMAALSEAFFSGFMLVQFTVVTLLVPALTGGAVAEEKERKTLEFLLATDLRNREIVLSKLAARLANVTLVVLVGLPILSLVQFFGGIQPDLLLAGFAALGLTVLSLTCLGIFFSVMMRRSRDAILLTYMTVAAYLGLASLGFLLFELPGLTAAPIWFGDNPYTVENLIWWVNAGNIFALMHKATTAIWGGQSLSAVLPGLVGEYFVFHAVIAVVCGVVAVLRLRALALKQDRLRQAVNKLPLWRRPRLRERAMVWKELSVEGGVRVGWFGTLVLAGLVLASFAPAVFLFGEVAVDYWVEVWTNPNAPRQNDYFYRGGNWRWFQDDVNAWARVTGSAVGALMLIGVAVRAAGSVSGEHARQTLDSLLTTPLESTSILGAKWLGAILCVRWGWLWLGAVWLVPLVIGAMNVVGVPLMVLALLVYAAGCAALGLWFSVVCRTSLRATIWTLTTLFALTAGQWVLTGLFVYLPLEMYASSPTPVDSLVRWQIGLTAPAALGVFGFRVGDFEGGNEFVEIFVSSLLGLVLWAMATYVLWRVILTRFRKLTLRIALQPERPAPRVHVRGPSAVPSTPQPAA